jgi:hypothetical protein
MKLKQAFHRQAEACSELGSPFTARLLRLCGDRLRAGTPLTDRLFAWPGDISGAGASLPLRLAGGLHALVRSGKSVDLSAAYPPNDVTDATLWPAVEAAMDAHHNFLNRWIDSPPQTNELRRSAVLIAAAHWLTDHFQMPLVLSELGASAGLNLLWDQYDLEINGARWGQNRAHLTLRPDWRGPTPPQAQVQIKERRGIDLNPLNPQDESDQLRLLSYLWADQDERINNTRKALQLPPAPVDQGDAVDWLEQRLSAPRPGHIHLIYHTIAWQYFPRERQQRGEEIIARAVENATPDAPVVRLSVEADGDVRGTGGAAITAQISPDPHPVPLGRTDFHGRWTDWAPPEISP